MLVSLLTDGPLLQLQALPRLRQHLAKFSQMDGFVPSEQNRKRFVKRQIFLAVLFAAQLLTGCATTTHFSDEYSKSYVAKKDLAIAPDCRMFIDTFSILFGEALVPCFNGRSEGAKERIIVPAGSPVRVKRLFNAITPGAELEVQDANGRSITAYFAYWPTYKEYYFLEVVK